MKLPIFKLEDYLSEREFKAPFSFCSSDLETSSLSEILDHADSEAKDLWNNLRLNYTEPKGHPLLRNEISQEYKRAEENNIFCFAGAEEGVFTAFHAILERDSHAIVVTPCYESLEEIPKSICEVTSVGLDPENDWKLDLEKVKNSIRPNTKLIVVNYPHNPTGSLITIEEQTDLVELARAHGIYVFSDEVYRLLEHNIKDRLPAMVDVYEKGLSLSVMSKAYGMAGLRVGWIAVRDKALLEKMWNIKHYLSICNSAPSELISLMCLRSREQILSRNRKLVEQNMSRLAPFFEKYQSLFSWTVPKATCVGFPLFKSNVPIDSFAKDLLEEKGVLILPGSVFNLKTNHFRISYGRKNMPEALERFGDFVEKHSQQW